MSSILSDLGKKDNRGLLNWLGLQSNDQGAESMRPISTAIQLVPILLTLFHIYAKLLNNTVSRFKLFMQTCSVALSFATSYLVRGII